jgi:D-alanine-D-alanine ligase
MKKIAVLYGGPSSEHDVSIASAKNVCSHFDTSKYEVIEVYIDRDGEYHIGSSVYSEDGGLFELKHRSVEVVFPLVHGTYGEDGVLQKKLETLKIPFVGSSSRSSAVAIDKHTTGTVLSSKGIHIPQSALIKRGDTLHALTYPIIIKPINEGSSVGLFKCVSQEEYITMLPSIFEGRNEMLAQEYIEGREFTCGVLEKEGDLFALLPTEIILTKTQTFDYTAKYTEGACKEITPAEVDFQTLTEIQSLAVKVHTLLGCSSFSRTDMILRGGILYVLEINTIPGMTKTSFFPAQAQASGYSMEDVVDLLVTSAEQKPDIVHHN